MQITKVEAIMIAALAVSIIAGAVQFGRLQGKIDLLDPEAIKRERREAIERIEKTGRTIVDELGELGVALRLTKLEKLMTAYRDRKWCNLGAQRKPGVAYTNDEPLPIELAVVTAGQGDDNPRNECRLRVVLNDDQVVIDQRDNNQSGRKYCSATVTIPANSTYQVSPRGSARDVTVVHWSELRGNCP